MPHPDPHGDPKTDPTALRAFVALAGGVVWRKRMADLSARVQPGSLAGRGMQQRHALELILARLSRPELLAKAGRAERRVLAFAREAAELAKTLPEGPRARLRALVGEGLTGHATLVPLFHLRSVDNKGFRHG